ncbi:TetR/AcrR family transcriptional regulator [Paenibacillus thermotolerans]|uniref:TetR/AcrR family transcriptional regulator n=1 Tax=Paenibacillus thermotolerans TaxID=3027807 RepID=UPI0023674A9C|nr:MULTISPECIES: TetR/AcrR family transcriptional regulator [unclassified Paenibacillus]
MSDTKRTYSSPLRQERKHNTIRSIVENTYRMHSIGVTDIKSIAEASNISVATIRKYFPTNEDLFQGCAAHFLEVNKLPEIHKYLHIADFAQKVRAIVTDFYNFYENTMELLWLSIRLADQSTVMRNSALQAEAIVKAAVQVMLQDQEWIEESRKAEIFGYTQSLLHPLFYRTLKTFGHLSGQQCADHTIRAIINLREEHL